MTQLSIQKLKIFTIKIIELVSLMEKLLQFCRMSNTKIKEKILLSLIEVHFIPLLEVRFTMLEPLPSEENNIKFMMSKKSVNASFTI